MTPNAFCNYCGTKFPEPLTYPRTCPGCKAQVWANPIPVAVALVPVGDGLLVVRRGIPPGIGKLALVGGFIEEHETWQVGMAREVREETGVVVDPAEIVLQSITSSIPKPNRILIFAVTTPVDVLPAFIGNAETQERGVIFGPAGLDAEFAFGTHADAARAYFAHRGVEATRPHAFEAR
ncbi:MAG TPA: NUDIX domain-containing protein [Kofleriaceae bacterium]|nr:NUDIX domain-containing protein [Kofleriaceae bacterium]